MKMMNVSLVSFVALFGIVGCTVKADDPDPYASGENLGAAESQLVEDDAEASDADDDVEVGLDEPLSGAAPSDPGAPAEGATDADLMEKVRTNPGLFFKPAGCITTTISGNVATHVFANCTGPYGMVSFDGTVTSTYTREPGKLTIKHVATGFKINGATISGSRIVVYTRAGSLVSKERTGSWSGATAKGRAISHEAHFTTTYDALAKCITRDGTATTSVGGRSLSRSIDDYKRCGIGRLGCPESGLLSIQASGPNGSLSLSLEFLGGRQVRITRPNGTQITRLLLCNPNAG